MGRSSRSSNSYPLGLSFVSLVGEARYVLNQKPSATLEEGSCREEAMSFVLEWSEDESWEKDEESRGAKGEGRGLVEGESEEESDI